MESYTYRYSSASSSYLEENTRKTPRTSFHASLHSVRKNNNPSKPWKKQHIAPFPPTPAKIYNVDFLDFKHVVQRLTSAPEFLQPPRRLQSVAPSPLNISSAASTWDAAKKLYESPIKSLFLATYNELMSETPIVTTENSYKPPLAPELPPPKSPAAWFNFPPLSPIVLSPARCSFPPILSPGHMSPAWHSFPSPSPGMVSPGWSSFPILSPGTISSLG